MGEGGGRYVMVVLCHGANMPCSVHG